MRGIDGGSAPGMIGINQQRSVRRQREHGGDGEGFRQLEAFGHLLRELGEVDFHLAVRRHGAAKLGDRELALPFDLGVGLGVGAGEDETADALGAVRDHDVAILALEELKQDAPEDVAAGIEHLIA